VGKSSLLNRFLGEERALVSTIAGTTRDSVDGFLEKGGRKYQFVDTAGIRRERHLKENVDHVSVVLARRSLERADVALLLLDAVEGLREMDAVIAGHVQEAGRAVVIAVNKWDLADESGLKQKAFREVIGDKLKFLPWAPIVFLSARTGHGLNALLDAASRAYESSRKRITTGQLNRMIADAVQKHPPKGAKGNKEVKVLFGTQIGVCPPTFALSLNHPVDLHFSYKRYLENKIREAFGFEGTPIVIKVRTRPH
jgi:GTP-binding protein